MSIPATGRPVCQGCGAYCSLVDFRLKRELKRELYEHQQDVIAKVRALQQEMCKLELAENIRQINAAQAGLQSQPSSSTSATLPAMKPLAAPQQAPVSSSKGVESGKL